MSKKDADWKDRYQKLSIEHESLQRTSDDTQKIFCRTLIRLAMSVKGLDNALDPYIDRIHETVKKDCGPGVRKKLDDLSDAMIRAADGQKKQDPFDVLVSHFAISDKDKKKAAKTWKKLVSDPLNIPDQVVDDLVELLGGQVNPALGDEKKGLFSRLFNSSSDSTEVPNLMLRSLLERLSWPNPIGPEIKSLVGTLNDSASKDMWISVITRVNEIVIDALSNFQSEVQSAEDFLAHLSSRLQELDGFVQGTHELREASLKSGRALNQTMNEQVDGISSSMNSVADLDKLKQSVAEKLDVIHSHVSKHLLADEERHAEALKREEHLREQLNELETEAQGLKQQMIEASMRAFKDAVTGLPNRQAYDQRIEQEYSRWKRFDDSLVLMVWDIDDFKKINDNFGHSSGDKALRVVAGKLKSKLRETDFIGRYGGEEFVVLLVGTDIEGAQLAAEKMREAIEKTSLKANNQEIHLTISCGFSQFQGDDTAEMVFERADQALYKAKREGKNRWIVG